MLSPTEIAALITAGLGGLGLGVKALVEWRTSNVSERQQSIAEMKALIEASAKIREELQEELERRGADLVARITRRDQKIIELEAHVANMQREIDLLRAENAKLLKLGCVRAVCERRELLPVRMPQ